MKISDKIVKKFQEGGAMTPETGAPAPAENVPAGNAPAENAPANPEEEIMAMAAQIIQSIGPDASMALAQAIMQLVQNGGPAPAQPTFAKRGGKIVRIK